MVHWGYVCVRGVEVLHTQGSVVCILERRQTSDASGHSITVICLRQVDIALHIVQGVVLGLRVGRWEDKRSLHATNIVTVVRLNNVLARTLHCQHPLSFNHRVLLRRAVLHSRSTPLLQLLE